MNKEFLISVVVILIWGILNWISNQTIINRIGEMRSHIAVELAIIKQAECLEFESSQGREMPFWIEHCENNTRGGEQ